MYTYDLLPSDGAIRLFVLEPGTGEQSLRGGLSTCNLDEAPSFEAISYVWGSPNRCIELVCDGKHISITLSLSNVLHRVRLPDQPRTLWTDLICINQEDLDEKGSQVSLMGKIYRRCNQTLIHIGTQDGGHGKPLLGLLDDIDRNIFANLQQDWDSAPYIEEDHHLAHDARWQSLRYLLDMPWFCRGWVVQEAAHARHGVVLWGDHEFSWTAIMRTTIWASLHAFSTICQNSALENSDLHSSCFSLLRKAEVKPFMTAAFWRNISKVLSTLHCGRYHDLADPRDRIYAFYDLPANNKCDKLQIRPDYHKSFSEVCKDFALHYLDVYDDLDLLLYVMHDEESLSGDFPSWIPLWGGSKCSYESEAFRSIYADDPPLMEKQEVKLSFRDGSNALRVSGLRFAKVRMASGVLTKEQFTFKGIARLWSEVCGVQNTKITADSDRFFMFLVTLCVGLRVLKLENKRQPEDDEAAFTLEIFNIVTGQAKRLINYVPSEEQSRGGDAQRFLSYVQNVADNKRLVVTDRGYGMAPAVVREDDECVILRGGKMPFLLRRADGACSYKLIGPIFHSSEYIISVDEDTEWHSGFNLGKSKDWKDWGIAEEEFYLV